MTYTAAHQIYEDVAVAALREAGYPIVYDRFHRMTVADGDPYPPCIAIWRAGQVAAAAAGLPTDWWGDDGYNAWHAVYGSMPNHRCT